MNSDDCANCSIYARSESVPYIVHESDMARLERANKRWFTLCVVLIAALVLALVGLWYQSTLYHRVTETTVTDVWQDSDNSSTNRFVGGDYYGGEAESTDGTYEDLLPAE